MITALTYSIIAHLKAQVPEVGGRVIWIYDGIRLDDEPVPHIRVEQLASTNTTTNAGRRDFSEVHSWQVGVFTRNVRERTGLSYTVAQALRQPNITLYDTRKTPVEASGGSFVIDVGSITPMPQDEYSRESHAHRAYINISVSAFRSNYDGLELTQ